MTKIHSIPTVYAGVRFRSRLEATWAVIFDLIGWTWRYEPIDLEGYIPDFLVKHPYPTEDWPASGGPEGWLTRAGSMEDEDHKLVTRLVEVKPELEVVDLIKHGKKIDDSGWDGPASIVGAYPHSDHDTGLILGVLRNTEKTGDWMYDWGGSWILRDAHMGEAAWIESSNRTQWRRSAGPIRKFLWENYQDNHGDLD